MAARIRFRGAAARPRRRLASVLASLALVLGLMPAAAAPAEAATLYGHDFSWPQCPTAVGGLGLPLPPWD